MQDKTAAGAKVNKSKEISWVAKANQTPNLTLKLKVKRKKKTKRNS